MSRVPIPDDWDGTSYCCRLIQWPSSEQWTAILLGLITWPMRGRFWDERTGTVTVVQEIGQEIYQKNVLDGGGCAMACLEDLTAVLADLALAIQGMSGGICGCPATATGEYPDPGTEIGDEGSEAPPGYEETPATNSEACNMSNWIWFGMHETIVKFRLYNIIGWVTFGVPALIGIIISLLTAGTTELFISIFAAQLGALSALAESLLSAGDSDLEEIQDWLEEEKEAIVCSLYVANNVAEAIANLDALADAFPMDALQKAIFFAIANNYTLAGRFFPSDAALTAAAELEDKIDCADCGQYVDCPFEFQYGTGSFRYDGESFTINAQLTGGYYLLNFLTDCGGENCNSSGNWCVTLLDTDIDTSPGYNRIGKGWTAACALNVTDYSDDSPAFPPLSEPLALGVLELTWDQPFYVTMRIDGPAGSLGVGETIESNSAGCE